MLLNPVLPSSSLNNLHSNENSTIIANVFPSYWRFHLGIYFSEAEWSNNKDKSFPKRVLRSMGWVWVGLGEVRKGVGVWKICLLGQCFAPQYQELAWCQNFTSPSSLTFLLPGLLHLHHKVQQWFSTHYGTVYLV